MNNVCCGSSFLSASLSRWNAEHHLLLDWDTSGNSLNTKAERNTISVRGSVCVTAESPYRLTVALPSASLTWKGAMTLCNVQKPFVCLIQLLVTQSPCSLTTKAHFPNTLINLLLPLFVASSVCCGSAAQRSHCFSCRLNGLFGFFCRSPPVPPMISLSQSKVEVNKRIPRFLSMKKKKKQLRLTWFTFGCHKLPPNWLNYVQVLYNSGFWPTLCFGTNQMEPLKHFVYRNRIMTCFVFCKICVK